MYYYKKYWLLLLVYIALGLGALKLGYKLLALLLFEVFKLLSLDMNKYTVIVNKMHTFSINWFNNLLATLILTIGVLICWFFINSITGQLKRDIASRQLIKSLLRHISSSNIKLVAEEEKLANKWIKFGRIISKQGKLMLKIPCGNNVSVINIIMKRCDGYVNQWLAQNYPRKNWAPIEVKHGLFITWLYVREK
ncbi:hypothetical protein [Ligilactobacillus agilis]|uniref:hypothetical protein n=1 Tax=Ligilactobacillus agilis TaxID=1601 RepID=UPI003F88B60E